MDRLRKKIRTDITREKKNQKYDSHSLIHQNSIISFLAFQQVVQNQGQAWQEAKAEPSPSPLVPHED